MTTDKTPADIWNEAIDAARTELAEATEYGGAYGQQVRKPSGWRRAAQHLATLPNPYGPAGPPARESPEWAALCQAAEALGKAAAEFANAKDDYTTKYPKGLTK